MSRLVHVNAWQDRDSDEGLEAENVDISGRHEIKLLASLMPIYD